ncbi:cystinosin homolog [Topomyia yanbarensis]|uniref:cystinosin homolog n=1 Tax=Topomyia yanbarensis TaxID=2498891 RepID=UPI00273B423B|nr:cystinosin homolog [Topomyia yanbarensis]
MLLLAVVLALFSVDLVQSSDTVNRSDHLKLWFDPQEYTTTLREGVILKLWISGTATSDVAFRFSTVSGSLVGIYPETVRIYADEIFFNNSTTLEAAGSRPGSFFVKASVEPDNIVDIRRLFVRLKIAISQPLIYISLLIGWAYAICWSVGDYPQIILNHRKKSVIGLSFDFLYMNVVGNLCYATFNAFMYWNGYVEQEYFNRHPFGLNPVIGNDVGYAMHALFATGVTLLQCYLFDNGGNSISSAAKAIILTYVGTILVSAVSVSFGLFHWLDFLYVLSYIKLSTNLIKYFPQVYINYKRQSTEGFAIMNRLLDLAGGLLSIVQMVINAWNFDDWPSIFGSPVKFALGFVSIFFDLVFIIQHFYLYKKPVEIPISKSEIIKMNLPSNI